MCQWTSPRPRVGLGVDVHTWVWPSMGSNSQWKHLAGVQRELIPVMSVVDSEVNSVSIGTHLLEHRSGT